MVHADATALWDRLRVGAHVQEQELVVRAARRERRRAHRVLAGFREDLVPTEHVTVERGRPPYVAHVEDEVAELTLSRDFGGLTRGTTLAFRAAGSEHSRAYLPVVPTTAEVIATDGHGRPALLRRQVGRGSLILCTYPVEYMSAVTARVNPDATVTLYNALGGACWSLVIGVLGYEFGANLPLLHRVLGTGGLIAAGVVVLVVLVLIRLRQRRIKKPST